MSPKKKNPPKTKKVGRIKPEPKAFAPKPRRVSKPKPEALGPAPLISHSEPMAVVPVPKANPPPMEPAPSVAAAKELLAWAEAAKRGDRPVPTIEDIMRLLGPGPGQR